MIDIATIKTIATEDLEINWSSKTVLELINRLEAAESQLAASEIVIQQLREHIADSADTAAIALRKAWQLGQTYWQQADS